MPTPKQNWKREKDDSETSEKRFEMTVVDMFKNPASAIPNLLLFLIIIQFYF